MIATWMLAAVALTALLGLAAFASEKALRSMGRQARVVWVAALAVGATWPFLAPWLAGSGTAPAAAQVVASGRAVAAPAPLAILPTAPSWGERAAALDAPLAIAWLVASLLLLARAAAGLRALRRLVHAASPRQLDGHEVLISSGGGPAAFGIMKPRILLPHWMLDLDDATRAMVLRHEREHLRAGDPALLTAAWAIVALMPWNVALWWIARRLRVAAELDCDRRVIRGGVDPRAYARLLLFISQRQADSPLAVSMAGSPSTLHERITAMHPVRPARPRLRAVALAALALVAATGASSPVIGEPLASVRPRVLSILERERPFAGPAPTATALPQGVPPRPTQQPAPPTPQPPRPTPQPPRVRPPLPGDSARKRGAPADPSARQVPRDSAARQAPRDSTARRTPADSTARRSPAQPASTRPDPGSASARPSEVTDSAGRVEQRLLPRAPVLLVHVDSGAGRQSYYDFAVQPNVEFAPGGSPALRYPEILRSAQRGGVLVVQMVVDTAGQMLPGSLKVIHKSHDLFEASFRAQMDQLRFRPARVGAQPVRQLVQLVYLFEVEGSPEPPAVVPASRQVLTLEVRVRAPRP